MWLNPEDRGTVRVSFGNLSRAQIGDFVERLALAGQTVPDAMVRE